MESELNVNYELLNVANYIKNISKKKITFAKIEAFMKKKELFTCKENLDKILGRWKKCNCLNYQRNVNIKMCKQKFSQ